MKKLKNSLFFPLLLLSMAVLMVGGILADKDTRRAIAQSVPIILDVNALDFAAVAEGASVVLVWTEADGAERYRLLFSFSHGATKTDYEIDMGLNTEFTLDFKNEDILETFNHIENFENIEAGLSFHVKVEAYDDEGGSRQSNVEYVLVGTGDYVAENGQYDTHKANESEGLLSDISAHVGTNFCDLFLEPARSCVLGTDIFVPVGGTNPFTASGGTTGFTSSSKDPSIATCGFTSPSQGVGWVSGVSQGSTQIDVWDGQGCHTVMTVGVVPAGGHWVYASNFYPPPYPYSNLRAGVYTEFTLNIIYPPGVRWLNINYDFGNLGSNSNSVSEEQQQSVLVDVETMEGASSNGTSLIMPVEVAGTIPSGYDYLVLWVEHISDDKTTVLAKSCQAGWLIDQ